MVMPRKYGVIALVLAFLMGFSRLYVGIHYPSDVLGGMVSGVITSIIAVMCFSEKTENLCNKFNKGSL